ncbi:hypothetical protein ACFX1Q_046125 [Malus domestica]
MAITFSDLYTDACLKALDEFLAGKSYISGDKMTLDDIKVYAAVLEKPAGSFANVAGVRVSSGKAEAATPARVAVQSSHSAALPSLSLHSQMEKEQEIEWIKAQNIGISVDLVAAAAGGDDDDDLDLFGDETEKFISLLVVLPAPNVQNNLGILGMKI